ncbi:MAG: RloB family protein, partial [Bacteroidota bacterium]
MARKKKSVQKKKTFAIVVDGKTEVWYFNMLKRNERTLKINIKPDLPSKKKLVQQYKYVRELAEYNTKVFWIIDLDTIVEETRKASSNSESPMAEFCRYRDRLKKDCNNVVPIVNCPCLEFWFLLHFETTAKYYESCHAAEKRLRKYLKDYEKTKSYFTRQNQDIYLKLKPQLNEAIENAKQLSGFEVENPLQAIAEMHLFFCDEDFE